MHIPTPLGFGPSLATWWADFCVAVLKGALSYYGTPGIFTTDQGSQFAHFAFTHALRGKGIHIEIGWK